MGKRKRNEVVESSSQVADYHDWKFIETRPQTIWANSNRTELLAEFAMTYARTCNSADEAVDVIEKPHHYAEEIASHISSWDLVDDETLARIGYWQCDACSRVEQRMTLSTDIEKSCDARA
jgi:hypothetical protein